jgi:hypothetical protein
MTKIDLKYFLVVERAWKQEILCKISKAQIFMNCSQNQKIFITEFCLNVEFEHRINGLMTYIWKKLRRSNERAQWAGKFVQNCQNPLILFSSSSFNSYLYLTSIFNQDKTERFCTITDENLRVEFFLLNLNYRDSYFSSTKVNKIIIIFVVFYALSVQK